MQTVELKEVPKPRERSLCHPPRQKRVQCATLPITAENRHFSYEDAGHTLNENHMMGGTAEGNRKARIDSQQRVTEFLNKLSDE
jgi:hypothetical protein